MRCDTCILNSSIKNNAYFWSHPPKLLFITWTLLFTLKQKETRKFCKIWDANIHEIQADVTVFIQTLSKLWQMSHRIISEDWFQITKIFINLWKISVHFIRFEKSKQIFEIFDRLRIYVSLVYSSLVFVNPFILFNVCRRFQSINR